MRTTITLDADVAALLKRLQERQGKSFKQVVNEALRAGLAQLDRPGEDRPKGPFTREVSLGKPRLPEIDDVTEVLATIEGENYR